MIKESLLQLKWLPCPRTASSAQVISCCVIIHAASLRPGHGPLKSAVGGIMMTHGARSLWQQKLPRRPHSMRSTCARSSSA